MFQEKKVVDKVSRAYLIGILFLAFANILFSGKAILVKIAYRYDTDASTLLALRMLFSMPIYAFIAHRLQKNASTEPITILQLIGTAVVLMGVLRVAKK
jgi:hypothetical protein